MSLGLLLAVLGNFHHCLLPVMISSVTYCVIFQIFSLNKQVNIKSDKNLLLKRKHVCLLAGWILLFQKGKKKRLLVLVGIRREFRKA